MPQYDWYCTVTDCEFEILSFSGNKDPPNKLVRSVIPCTAKIMPACKGCGLKVKLWGASSTAFTELMATAEVHLSYHQLHL